MVNRREKGREEREKEEEEGREKAERCITRVGKENTLAGALTI